MSPALVLVFALSSSYVYTSVTGGQGPRQGSGVVASRGCVRIGVTSGQGSHQGRVASALPDREVDLIAELARSQSRPDRKVGLVAKQA